MAELAHFPIEMSKASHIAVEPSTVICRTYGSCDASAKIYVIYILQRFVEGETRIH